MGVLNVTKKCGARKKGGKRHGEYLLRKSVEKMSCGATHLSNTGTGLYPAPNIERAFTPHAAPRPLRVDVAARVVTGWPSAQHCRRSDDEALRARPVPGILCAVELPAIFSGSFLLRGSINSKSAAVHIFLEEASLRLPFDRAVLNPHKSITLGVSLTEYFAMVHFMLLDIGQAVPRHRLVYKFANRKLIVLLAFVSSSTRGHFSHSPHDLGGRFVAPRAVTSPFSCRSARSRSASVTFSTVDPATPRTNRIGTLQREVPTAIMQNRF